MKTFLALAALVLGACGAPLSGVNNPSDSPKGVFFVLPPAPQTPSQISPEQVEEVMNQLRQEDGSDSGVYHIVLPDGRLQRVEYTTAPVTEQQTPSQQQQAAPVVPGPAALLAQPFKPSVAPVKTAPAQLQERPAGPAALVAQSPRPAPAQVNEQINLGPNPRLFLVAQPVAEEESAQINEKPATPVKYVASIQYTEVQPITGPIYSYNNQPLTRVVRYAPLY